METVNPLNVYSQPSSLQKNMLIMRWYEDMDAMARDDAHLNAVFDRLREELSPDARDRIASVHIYPSRLCTYTIDKQRIFVRVRDANGELHPDCVLRHVILHELGPGRSVWTHGPSRCPHVINPTFGHDGGFRGWLAWLRGQAGAAATAAMCAGAVPSDFNPCR